mmetsp:Transcript_82636/g.145789  ORF Transcript_82636/g.145789 Transcript_82636/m.145789 type:complete len:216 (-) Transcript_82636:358-1005(-)
MLRCFLSSVCEKVRFKLLPAKPRLLPEKGVNAFNCRILLHLRRSKVEFKAVASGDHGCLRHHVAVTCPRKLHQLLRILVPLSFSHSKLLPDLYWCTVMAETNHMNLHHGLNTIVTCTFERFKLLNGMSPDACLAREVELLEVLPEFALANSERRIPQSVNGINQRSQKCVHLAENTAELCLAQGPHRVNDLTELPTPQELCLILQGADLRDKFCD